MPAENVSEEVSHLVSDKGFKQDRAVAASLDMKRRGAFRKPRVSARVGRRKGRR